MKYCTYCDKTIKFNAAGEEIQFQKMPDISCYVYCYISIACTLAALLEHCLLYYCTYIARMRISSIMRAIW